MNSESSFNLTVFTNDTKNICSCTAVSIFLIVLFIISPLSNLFKISLFMKILVIILLTYTIYLNINQIKVLKSATSDNISDYVKSQLNINILCSYIFTLFLGLLCIFVLKSFF
jgi:hypothetical protein